MSNEHGLAELDRFPSSASVARWSRKEACMCFTFSTCACVRWRHPSLRRFQSLPPGSEEPLGSRHHSKAVQGLEQSKRFAHTVTVTAHRLCQRARLSPSRRRPAKAFQTLSSMCSQYLPIWQAGTALRRPSDFALSPRAAPLMAPLQQLLGALFMSAGLVSQRAGHVASPGHGS